MFKSVILTQLDQYTVYDFLSHLNFKSVIGIIWKVIVVVRYWCTLKKPQIKKLEKDDYST